MAEIVEDVWKRFGKKCIIYPFALFYASLYCLWLIIYSLLNPGKKFWQSKERPNPPDCLQDKAYGTHKYVKVNNINMHYIENGNRDKPLMVFLHGFPEFWYSWRHQIVEFSQDYWTVALDLRGFGESERPREKSKYEMINMLEDVRQLVVHLGRKKFILVSHDWGGILAWNFMDLYPEMVSQFIIISSPYYRSWIRVMASSLRQFLYGWYILFFHSPILPEISIKFNDMQLFDNMGNENENIKQVQEAYKYTFSREGALRTAIDYYRVNISRLVLAKETPKNLPPGLYVLGDKDNYIVSDFLGHAKEVIPNLQTLLLKDCNHFMQQSNPKIVNATIRNFLNKFEMVNGVK